MDPNASTKLEIRGGLARLKTLINQIRKENPSTILMNIGDTFHGGAEAFFTMGNAIVEPVNELGIDVGVPGNWDFAYGPAVFRKRYTPEGPFPFFLRMMLPSFPVKSARFPNLAANLTYKSMNWFDSSPDGEGVLPGSMLIEREGIRIGFIGLTSDMVPRMHFMLAKGFHFLQEEKTTFL